VLTSMKNIVLNKKFITIITLGIIWTLGLFLFKATLADEDDNLGGHAWSSNIGWISFNCINEDSCETSNYGVGVDLATGAFSGHAWSSNIGWISFNRADTGNPPSNDPGSGSGPIAVLNTSTNVVDGWARALANGGGWDGWIRFDHGQSDPVTRNTGVSPNEFIGYAWGSDVVGWTSLNCSNESSCGTSDYQVYFATTQPTVDNLTASFNVDSGPACVSRMRFQWQFSGASSQSAYHLQVANDAGFTDLQFDSGKTMSAAQERFVNISTTPVNELEFNSSYYWRIEVFDDDDTGSGWVEYDSNPFSTSLHPYPTPAFTWSPQEPSEEENVDFTDQTTWDAGVGTKSWDWSFVPDATPATSTAQNPTVVFSNIGEKTVTLTVADSALATDPDSGTGECTVVDTVDVNLPLPEFREVPPVTFLNKIWTAFLSLFDIVRLSSHFALAVISNK